MDRALGFLVVFLGASSLVTLLVQEVIRWIKKKKTTLVLTNKSGKKIEMDFKHLSGPEAEAVLRFLRESERGEAPDARKTE